MDLKIIILLINSYYMIATFASNNTTPGLTERSQRSSLDTFNTTSSATKQNSSIFPTASRRSTTFSQLHRLPSQREIQVEKELAQKRVQRAHVVQKEKELREKEDEKNEQFKKKRLPLLRRRLDDCYKTISGINKKLQDIQEKKDKKLQRAEKQRIAALTPESRKRHEQEQKIHEQSRKEFFENIRVIQSDDPRVLSSDEDEV